MANKDVIIACDFGTREETLAFLDRFTAEKPYVKIGMEPVSYTHLTLPTSHSVQISGVAESIKKKKKNKRSRGGY